MEMQLCTPQFVEPTQKTPLILRIKVLAPLPIRMGVEAVPSGEIDDGEIAVLHIVSAGVDERGVVEPAT